MMIVSEVKTVGKFTAGPWRISEASDECYGETDLVSLWIRGPETDGPLDSMVIASVISDCIPEYSANASLIAAAPCLLQVLEEAISMLGSRLIKDTFGYEWHEKATGAIARARGLSQ